MGTGYECGDWLIVCALAASVSNGYKCELWLALSGATSVVTTSVGTGYECDQKMATSY